MNQQLIRRAAFAGTRQRGGTALTVLLIIVALAIIAGFVLPFAFSYYMLNRMVRENPQLSAVPAPLPAAPMMKTKPTTLTCCGIQFDVPWGPPEPYSKDLSKDYAVDFIFPGGKSVSVKQPQHVTDPIFTFMSNERIDSSQEEALQRTLGFKVSTRYEAMEKALQHLPQSPRFLSGREYLTREMLLTMSKSAYLLPDSTGVFSFTNQNGRGFQISDPSRSQRVTVHLFDPDDRHIEFSVWRSADSPPLQQSEIDFIVRSIRPAPEPSETPAPAKQPTPGKRARAPEKKAP